MYASDLDEALVPLFIRSEHSTKLHQVATGIFVDFRSQPFLFTAAHVTDNLHLGDLMVPVCGDIEPIDGYVRYIDLPPEMPREKDEADIAYFRLNSDFARSMCSHFRPLPQSRSTIIRSALELGVCSICGYPSSKAKAFQGQHTSETAKYTGMAAREETYSQLGLSPDSSIVVHFHRKRAISLHDGKRLNPLSPKGVSGGGIFAWPAGQELSEDWSLPQLIGIFHTYKKSEGLMIGTHLITVMAAVQLGQMKGFGGVR